MMSTTNVIVLSCLAIAVSATSRALTEAERTAVMDAHNVVRRGVAQGKQDSKGGLMPPAANMREVIYDEELEGYARTWTDACVWKHSTKYENLAALGGEQTNLTSALLSSTTLWHNEYKKYEQSPEKFVFDTEIGHFSAQIWATTYRIGCAVNFCSQLEGGISNASFIACNYAPSGNRAGDAIYITEDSCSLCPYGTVCKSDLCAVDPNYTPRTTPELTPTEQYTVLKTLNDHRRNLAKGQALDANNNTYPEASNMFEVIYDPELEKLAIEDIKVCGISSTVGGHQANTVLIVANTTADENGPNFSYLINSNFNPAAYNGTVDSYNGVKKEFANVAWAKVEKIGCARTVCYESYNKMNLTKVVCVFGDEQSAVKGEPIYVQGAPCSQCPEGYHCNDGLCSRTPLSATPSPTDQPTTIETEVSTQPDETTVRPRRTCPPRTTIN